MTALGDVLEESTMELLGPWASAMEIS